MTPWAESMIAACGITSFAFMPCKGSKKLLLTESSVTLAMPSGRRFSAYLTNPMNFLPTFFSNQVPIKETEC